MMEHLEQLQGPVTNFMGDVTYGELDIEQTIRTNREMFVDHWNEVGIWKDERPLDPDWDLYIALAKTKRMRAWGAFCARQVVGYSTYVISPSLNYRGWLTATNGIFYLAPEFRRRVRAENFAREFFESADYWLASLGCKSVRYASKVGKTNTKVFVDMGYQSVEEVWEKLT